MPATPGRLSTITCTPSAGARRCWIARVVTSEPPAGDEPVTKRTIFDGYATVEDACASATSGIVVETIPSRTHARSTAVSLLIASRDLVVLGETASVASIGPHESLAFAKRYDLPAWST
jgi:hypothetical protein